MASKRSLAGKITQDLESSITAEIALAAIVPFKKQKDVTDFVNFILNALERNSNWLNSVITRQKKFKCVLMMGAGPGRFQVKDTIYPQKDTFKLEVELRNSADYDKIAISAVVILNQGNIETLLKFLDSNCKCENGLIREDLLRGKAMGVTYAILHPNTDGQYRVIQNIVVDKPVQPLKAIKAIKELKAIKESKRREKLAEPPKKKTRKVK